MSLKMPSPTRRANTSVIQFRQRIPEDVLEKARGYLLAIPLGDGFIIKRVSPKAVEVTCSLKTRDPVEAKARAAKATDYLSSVWNALRAEPVRLTNKEAVGLSGELYENWSILEDDPGPVALWEEINKVNESALAGEFGLGPLMIGDKAKRMAALEGRFGGFVDVLLAHHALNIDEQSRALLTVCVAEAMVQVSDRLARHAKGDYRPDPLADRFPPVPERIGKKAKETTKATESFESLIDARWQEAKAAGGSAKTLAGWRVTFKHLATFLGHTEAARVTRADVLAFKDHRLATGISPKTVRDNDLAALKSVFGWAVDNDRLTSNPAKDVSLKLGRAAKRDRGRPKGFTDDESVEILRFARDYRPKTRREEKKALRAKRWVPWLLAFSGARVSEVLQLRKQDVFEQAGRWIMLVTPEAGTVKSGRARSVPLHR